MEELTQAIQALDRAALLDLRRSINARLVDLAHPQINIDPDAVVRTASEIVGVDINTRRRDAESTRARMIAAYRLHRAGMRHADIAPHIHRLRPDVYYLVEQMKFILGHPQRYAVEVRDWDALTEQYPL